MRSEAIQKPGIGRRELLRMLGTGAAGLAAAGIARRADAACAATPPETQGPFWVDEMLNRSDIRSDPTSGAIQAGLPLRLAINVSEIDGSVCAPVSGAYVDIWHCSALGAYSDVSGAGNPNTIGQRWLRGYQVSDAHGNVRFLTIYPGWYMGRTVHIHFRVRKFSGAVTTFNFTSQMYFDDAVSNAIYASTAPYSAHLSRNPASNIADALFDSDLMLRMSHNGDHVVASFDAVIDSTTGISSSEHSGEFGGGSPVLALPEGGSAWNG